MAWGMAKACQNQGTKPINAHSTLLATHNAHSQRLVRNLPLDTSLKTVGMRRIEQRYPQMKQSLQTA